MAQVPEGTDARVIEVNDFPERGIVKYYDHMFVLRFLPTDADKMIGDQAMVEDSNDRKSYVYGSSYPINTAYTIAGKINEGK